MVGFEVAEVQLAEYKQACEVAKDRLLAGNPAWAEPFMHWDMALGVRAQNAVIAMAFAELRNPHGHA